MSLRARVDAMKPSQPGPTRTAPPRMPNHFPGRGNYVGYVAFGLCGFLLYAISFLMLRTVWALGSGRSTRCWWPSTTEGSTGCSPAPTSWRTWL